MLVLTRRAKESICIGPNIEVKILRTSNKEMKIGITAPPAVKIIRAELCKPRSREK